MRRHSMPGRTSRPWPATSSSVGSRMPSRRLPVSRIWRTQKELEEDQRRRWSFIGPPTRASKRGPLPAAVEATPACPMSKRPPPAGDGPSGARQSRFASVGSRSREAGAAPRSAASAGRCLRAQRLDRSAISFATSRCGPRFVPSAAPESQPLHRSREDVAPGDLRVLAL
jgi:hypothetical protein